MEELLNIQKSINFIKAVALQKNWSIESATKTVVTRDRAMLMHAALKCPKEKLSTDLWPMEMEDSEWIYNWVYDIQCGPSDLRYGQDHGLSQLQTPYLFVVFGILKIYF